MDNKVIGSYDIVKLCKGGLVLNLPAYDSSAINRRVEIENGVTKVRVPRTYALGVFIDPTLEYMYREGYFTVEPKAEFEKEVATIFAPVVESIPVATDEEIVKALKSGNRVKIRSWLNTTVNKDKVIILARENIGDISTSMIADLEKDLGVELTVDDE